MKLELKKIKYCKWMSEETHCYSAVVYVDGKATIEVSNEGHGGGDNQWAIKPFTEQDIEKVELGVIKIFLNGILLLTKVKMIKI